MNISSSDLIPLVQAALQRGQRVRMTATGSSMRPFLHDGDVVELEPAHVPPLLGDVVLVRGSEGRYILHRVVRLEQDSFFVRGDVQREWEGPFDNSALVGRVSRAFRRGRVVVIDRGVWRLAGRLWIHCSSLGLALLEIVDRARALRRRILQRSRKRAGQVIAQSRQPGRSP